jgi:hypothetical protein
MLQATACEQMMGYCLQKNRFKRQTLVCSLFVLEVSGVFYLESMRRRYFMHAANRIQRP